MKCPGNFSIMLYHPLSIHCPTRPDGGDRWHEWYYIAENVRSHSYIKGVKKGYHRIFCNQRLNIYRSQASPIDVTQLHVLGRSSTGTGSSDICSICKQHPNWSCTEFTPLPSSHAIVCYQTFSKSISVMSCRLFGAKPFPWSMLNKYKFHLDENN